MKDWPRVYVGEESELDDFDMVSGRFHCHVEFEEEMGEEIEGLSLPDALRWARERADVVLLRLFDSGYCSAGAHNPDPEEIPPWPEDAVVTRRRPQGLEALDNTERDPPVLWDLRLSSGQDVDEARFRERVEADERTLSLPAESVDPRIKGVRVLVKVSTRDQAWALAESIWRAAREAGGPQQPLRGPVPYMAAGYEVYPYVPGRRFAGGPVRMMPAIMRVDDEESSP